jgi:hypothetical protein
MFPDQILSPHPHLGSKWETKLIPHPVHFNPEDGGIMFPWNIRLKLQFVTNLLCFYTQTET